MRTAKLLVLDGQGVVFNSPIKSFLSSFANDNQLEYARVENRWESRVRELAWRGLISDEQLWTELAGKEIDVGRTMLKLNSSYKPGPAARHLARWSRIMPVWLLSNHRSAWLLPKLEAFGLGDAFEKLLISDRTGFIKPEPEAFQQMLQDSQSPKDILFVDDQLHNVEAAQTLGCRTVFAARGHPWLEAIDAAIHVGFDSRTAAGRR